MRVVIGAIVSFALSVAAARADPTHDEIAYLIDFIRHSSCTFIRNGSEYTGNEAADHVQAKYDYYKDQIETVDDFIDRAATKSELSGKPYTVRCEGKTMPAADWIRAEDAAHRAQESQGTTGN
jgi:hypothetical protein